jgi:hypothetical protein
LLLQGRIHRNIIRGQELYLDFTLLPGKEFIFNGFSDCVDNKLNSRVAHGEDEVAVVRVAAWD